MSTGPVYDTHVMVPYIRSYSLRLKALRLEKSAETSLSQNLVRGLSVTLLPQ